MFPQLCYLIMDKIIAQNLGHGHAQKTWLHVYRVKCITTEPANGWMGAKRREEDDRSRQWNSSVLLHQTSPVALFYNIHWWFQSVLSSASSHALKKKEKRSSYGCLVIYIAKYMHMWTQEWQNEEANTQNMDLCFWAFWNYADDWRKPTSCTYTKKKIKPLFFLSLVHICAKYVSMTVCTINI